MSEPSRVIDLTRTSPEMLRLIADLIDKRQPLEVNTVNSTSSATALDTPSQRTELNPPGELGQETKADPKQEAVVGELGVLVEEEGKGISDNDSIPTPEPVSPSDLTSHRIHDERLSDLLTHRLNPFRNLANPRMANRPAESEASLSAVSKAFDHLPMRPSTEFVNQMGDHLERVQYAPGSTLPDGDLSQGELHFFNNPRFLNGRFHWFTSQKGFTDELHLLRHQIFIKRGVGKGSADAAAVALCTLETSLREALMEHPLRTVIGWWAVVNFVWRCSNLLLPRFPEDVTLFNWLTDMPCDPSRLHAGPRFAERNAEAQRCEDLANARERAENQRRSASASAIRHGGSSSSGWDTPAPRRLEPLSGEEPFPRHTRATFVTDVPPIHMMRDTDGTLILDEEAQLRETAAYFRYHSPRRPSYQGSRPLGSTPNERPVKRSNGGSPSRASSESSPGNNTRWPNEGQPSSSWGFSRAEDVQGKDRYIATYVPRRAGHRHCRTCSMVGWTHRCCPRCNPNLIRANAWNNAFDSGICFTSRLRDGEEGCLLPPPAAEDSSPSW